MPCLFDPLIAVVLPSPINLIYRCLLYIVGIRLAKMIYSEHVLIARLSDGFYAYYICIAWELLAATATQITILLEFNLKNALFRQSNTRFVRRKAMRRLRKKRVHHDFYHRASVSACGKTIIDFGNQGDLIFVLIITRVRERDLHGMS